MANLRLASGKVPQIMGLVSSFALWSCGAASDRLPPEQQSRDATASEGDPGADDDDGAGDGTDDGPVDADGTPLALARDAAVSATWQELGTPGASNRPDLTGTPGGWLALSQRTVGDARAPSAWESYLYRSTDGIRWHNVHISDETDNPWLRGVAYAAGRYVP